MASNPPARGLTAIAAIYGHPLHGRHPNVMLHRYDHDVLENGGPLKSGLTPLHPDSYRTVDEAKYYHIATGYQRDRLRMFTATELETLEAWAPVRVGDEYKFLSDVPLHPLVEKKRWDSPLPLHQALCPLRNGRDGYWTTSNDIVWNAMLPSLRLASQYLSQSQTLQWWYALLFGDYDDVDPNDVDWGSHVPENRQIFYHWHPQLSRLTPTDIDAEVQKKFKQLSEDIELHVCSGMITHDSGIFADYCDGITIYPTSQQKTQVYIHSELIEPLLNQNITIADRMMAIHVLSATIIHELSHAIWQCITEEHIRHLEPHFENEVWCELGFSMQNSVWGAVHDAFISPTVVNAKGVPHAGFFEVPWNSRVCATLAIDNPPMKAKPIDWDEHILYPVKLDSFFRENYSEFWTQYVKKLGPTAAYLQRAPWGNKFVAASGYAGLCEDPAKHRIQDYIIIDRSKMTEVQMLAAQKENSRRQQAKDITSKILALYQANKKVPVIYMGNSVYRYQRKNSASISNDPNKILSTPNCPKFNLILYFVITTREVLAWDTLHFKLSEHILYAHITRYKKDVFTADEWRDFLITCSNNNMLFDYEYIGGPPTPIFGVVRRNANGWPPSVLPQRNLPNPSRYEVGAFVEGIRRFAKSSLKHFILDDQWCDYDKNLLRRLVNEQLKLRLFDLDGVPTDGLLTVEAFDRVIAWCERINESWCFGPPGIIRKSPTWDIQKWK
ncbi:hypothetical protein EG329_012122 [Mollisiaceae sp. DMI_Dod_QoI]|nr:hypothetical protein EG329_012122 [Helotiales sp. DMI_Dod_QoI]